MTITSTATQLVAERLAPTGLNRCRFVPLETLPPRIWLRGQEPPVDSEAGSEPLTLVIVGHAGPTMWSHLHQPSNSLSAPFDDTDDPIDSFSIKATDEALAALLPEVARTLLYPHPECPLDLVAVGQEIAWQTASPLGLGIHPDYGLWSAFRAAWILHDELQPSGPDDHERYGPSTLVDTCARCTTHDCVRACPADAVQIGHRFDVTACFGHRRQPDSGCAQWCHARVACPEGEAFVYSDAQIKYHYEISRPPPADVPLAEDR